MTTLAVTGHMDLTEESVPRVAAALRELVAGYAGYARYAGYAEDAEATGSDLVGLSCLARGADSLFAEAVLAAGGRLVAVLPSRDYRQAKVGPDHAARFDRLLAAAAEVVVMDRASADRAAYEAANAELLRRADRLVAVWNGRPPGGRGGTADVVARARAAGLPVDVVWPPGASRSGG